MRYEGGYVCDPADPGGETHYGISRRTYPHVDLRHLTPEQAKILYFRDFWAPYGYGRLRDPATAAKVFDLAVNCGPVRAHTLLQRALCAVGRTVVVDGRLGRETLNAANAVDPPGYLLAMLILEAVRHYANLAAEPKRAKFLRGWVLRACDTLKAG